MQALGAHETIAEYKLVKYLGQGCLGRVFLAEHLFMKTLFALKVLPEELTSKEGFLERFQKDISFISQLDHPSIAKLQQVSHSNGLYYIVSEPILYDERPVNLFEYIALKGGLLKEDEIFNLLMQIASALDYANSQTNDEGLPLSHLSLRPSNILVTRRNDQMRFVLTDLGLYRCLGAGHILKNALASVASSFDSFDTDSSSKDFNSIYHCMSPEQRNPRLLAQTAKTLTTASDIYSFGAIAYFLLCGEFPEGAFELPSVRRSDLRYNWDRMIMACLSMKANKRPKKLVNLLEAVSISCILEEDEEEDFSQEHAALSTPKVAPVKAPVSTPTPSFFAGPVSSQANIPQTGSMPGSSPSAHSFSGFSPSYYQSPASAQNPIQKQSMSSQGIASQSLHDHEAPIRPVAAAAHISQDCRPASPRNLAQSQNASWSGANAAQRSLLSTPSQAPVPLLKKSEESIENVPSHLSDSLDIEKAMSISFQSSKFVKSHETLHEAEMGPTPMMTIRGGRYMRGSNEGSRDEMPRHAVVVGDFAIDIHPVSNEQFVKFLKTLPGEKDEQNNDIIRLKESRIKRIGGKLLIEPGYNRHPVVGVTWYGTQAYCKWIGRRLPTEAEWEIASRGGFEDAVYPSGDEIEKSQANFFNNDTTAVMSYPPNSYGLFDMAGNVYEWCQDWYAYNTYELTAAEPMYPQGPMQGVYRVLRGGCWKSLKEDLRCSHRHRNNPGAVNRTYGFRCASDLEGEE